MVLPRCSDCGTHRPRIVFRNGFAKLPHSGSKPALWRNNGKAFGVKRKDSFLGTHTCCKTPTSKFQDSLPRVSRTLSQLPRCSHSLRLGSVLRTAEQNPSYGDTLNGGIFELRLRSKNVKYFVVAEKLRLLT